MSRDHSNRTGWSTAADAFTVVVALIAVGLGALTVWERTVVRSSGSEPVAEGAARDWPTLMAGPNRIGPPSPPVTVVEFGDFECPFCARFERAARAVRPVFRDRVAFVHRNFPLPQHEFAYRAAVLAQCAGDQGRYAAAREWLYRDKMAAEQTVEEVASRVGVANAPAFLECVDEGDFHPQVSTDLDLARAEGVRVTPTVFINGRRLDFTPDSTQLHDLIRDELMALDRGGG